MSISMDVIRENHLDLYQELDRIGESAERVVQDYMDKATVLHAALPLQEDKADVIAHRDSVVLALRQILGV